LSSHALKWSLIISRGLIVAARNLFVYVQCMPICTWKHSPGLSSCLGIFEGIYLARHVCACSLQCCVPLTQRQLYHTKNNLPVICTGLKVINFNWGHKIDLETKPSVSFLLGLWNSWVYRPRGYSSSRLWEASGLVGNGNHPVWIPGRLCSVFWRHHWRAFWTSCQRLVRKKSSV